MSSSTVAVAATAVAFALQGCGGIYEPVTTDAPTTTEYPWTLLTTTTTECTDCTPEPTPSPSPSPSPKKTTTTSKGPTTTETTTKYVPPPPTGFELWKEGYYCSTTEVKQFDGMAKVLNCANEVAVDTDCSEIFYFGTKEGKEDNLCRCLLPGEDCIDVKNPEPKAVDLDLYKLTGENAELTCDVEHASTQAESWKITFFRSRTFEKVDEDSGTETGTWDGDDNDLEIMWDSTHTGEEDGVHHTSDGGETFDLQKKDGYKFICSTLPAWFLEYWSAEMLSV